MEIRGGDRGAQYGADLCCPGCGVGLLVSERCGIPDCPRYGQRAYDQAPATRSHGPTMSGEAALRMLDDQFCDPVEQRAMAHMRESQRLAVGHVTTESALKWLRDHPAENL